MPFSQNTSGTTGDGILAALTDLVNGTNSSPYVKNTSGTTLDGILAALADLVKGTNSQPYARNTSGATLDRVLDALTDRVNAADHHPYVGNSPGTTIGGVLDAVSDLVTGSDRRPYSDNAPGTTISGWLQALTAIIAGGGLGATIHLSNATVADTASIGDTIGILSVVGGTGTYTFTLTSNPSSLFAVDVDHLKVAAALSAGSDAITVHADNGAGSVLNRTLLITVTHTAAGHVPTFYILGF